MDKRVGPMGYDARLGSKAQAQNWPGSLIPYISPPLIHARLPGTNQGSQRIETTREAQQVDTRRLGDPLMRPKKVCCI